jgi:hypothetical protein
VEQLLTRYPDRKMRALIVWEPILPSDWKKPSGSILAHVSDARVRQFWDPKHLVAQELARLANHEFPQVTPVCCVRKGLHWDEAVLYAPHAQWREGPTPVFWNGPVFRITPALEKAWTALR